MIGVGFGGASRRLGLTVKNYGAKVDGVTDDTAAIQAMIDELGFFVLPIGTTVITDTLIIPSGTLSYGTVWSGEGKEKSIISCSGMTGKPAIKHATQTGYIRVTMRDFQITGDCDTCIDLTTSLQLYQSIFENLDLSSAANSAFKATNTFQNTWINIHLRSDSGHGIETNGGNTNLLINCYAHDCGSGKAGYRIKGSATLISCNGLDSGDIWGWFGANTSDGDASNRQATINMIGCNVEAWTTRGLYLSYESRLKLEGCSFTKTSGTFTDIIRFASSNHALNITNTTVTTTGATRTATSNIQSFDSIKWAYSNSQGFVDYYKENVSLLYALPYHQISDPAFQIKSLKLNYLDYDRSYGFNLQAPVTWTANANTFSVTGKTKIKTANTAATDMRNATGGVEGQDLCIHVNDANSTIKHNYGGAGSFLTTSGADIVATSGRVYRFQHTGTNWQQI